MTPLGTGGDLASRIVGPISRTISGCYPGRPFPLVAVVTMYADASMERGIVSVGGYLSTFEHWDLQFVPAWRDMLADPSWPTTPIREFHATDCRTGGGEFRRERGWTDEERRRLMVRAVGVVTSAIPPEGMVGLATVIELPPIPSHKALLAYQRFAFFMCFQQIVQSSLRVTAHHLTQSNDEVQFIFDEQKGYEGDAREMFKQARDTVASFGVDVTHLVPEPLFRESEAILPLQAADLLAHESYKEVRNRQDGRPLSGALRALVKGRVHYGDFIDASTFARLERASREGTVTGITKEEFPGLGRLFDSNHPLRGEPGFVS